MSTLWLRRLSYSALLFILTSGASLLLGFLSFTGFLSIWPILPLAFASFGLCIVFDGDVISKNIYAAMDKLLNPYYFEYAFGKHFLLTNAPDPYSFSRQSGISCPLFFSDYDIELQNKHRITSNPEESDYEKKILQCERRLQKMEEWFSHQLYDTTSSETEYAKSVKDWLTSLPQVSIEKEKLRQFKSRNLMAQNFSLLAGFFMGLGTTYLLMEALMAIPVLAALSGPLLPAIILPIAIISGIAYALQTYHALTDMLAHKTIERWYQKIMEELEAKNYLFPTIAIFLCIAAAALTICTAGTWWTIAKQGKPLFEWMKQLPTVIMGVITPIITGIASLAFTLQNTSESLQLVETLMKAEAAGTETAPAIPLAPAYIRYNPFGLLITSLVDPLRMLLFVGHTVSNGFTSTQIPWVPHVFSTGIGSLVDAGADLHFFYHPPHKTHNHTSSGLRKQRLEEQHEHQHNIPEQLIHLLFTPLVWLAAAWDYTLSNITWENAFNKYSFNAPPKKDPCFYKNQQTTAIYCTQELQNPQISRAWKIEEGLLQIEQLIEPALKSAWFNKSLAKEKQAAILRLKENMMRKKNRNRKLQDPFVIINNALGKEPVLMQHRHPWFSIWKPSRCLKTHTHARLEEMSLPYLLT